MSPVAQWHSLFFISSSGHELFSMSSPKDLTRTPIPQLISVLIFYVVLHVCPYGIEVAGRKCLGEETTKELTGGRFSRKSLGQSSRFPVDEGLESQQSTKETSEATLTLTSTWYVGRSRSTKKLVNYAFRINPTGDKSLWSFGKAAPVSVIKSYH